MENVKNIEVIDTNTEEVVEKEGLLTKAYNLAKDNSKTILGIGFGLLTGYVCGKCAKSFKTTNFVDVTNDITDVAETLTETIN